MGLIYLSILTHEDMLVDFREKGKGERERQEKNIHVREKHQSVASGTRPDWGPNPQPRHVP